jgi:hypothetical protein
MQGTTTVESIFMTQCCVFSDNIDGDLRPKADFRMVSEQFKICSRLSAAI